MRLTQKLFQLKVEIILEPIVFYMNRYIHTQHDIQLSMGKC